MVENALARSTARAIGGDSSSSVITNRRSSSLSLSGSLQQARRLARGRRLGLGRLGRWHLICGRVLTALAGSPLADDSRLSGEAARAGLPPHPGPLAIAR